MGRVGGGFGAWAAAGHLPSIDGRTILLERRTEPDKDTAQLPAKLGITLPGQPPPKISADSKTATL